VANTSSAEQGVRELLDEADQLEGLGDVVSKVTKKLGIKECAGCRERRRWLNDKVSFRRRRRTGCRNCG